MAKERRDNKNRILWKGEYQRKDGRYMYKYKDAAGESRFVYSWTLTQTDRPPKGRQAETCLRELEKEISRDLVDDIDRFQAQKMSLNDCFDKYIAQKKGLKRTALANYKCMYEKYVRNDIGTKKISNIKYSDIKKFYTSLLFDKNLKPNSVGVINSVLHPIFSIAVRDNYIRTNPADGVFAEISKDNHFEQVKRHALTEPQQEAFITYIKNHKIYKRWYQLFAVMLGTGCRVGEISGLKWEDCDFDNNTISIKRSVSYLHSEEENKYKKYISSPKTSGSVRIIPMFVDVRNALLEEKEKQAQLIQSGKISDKHSEFVFTNRSGEILIRHNVNEAICNIVRSYNRTETEAANKEGREPLLLPNFTVHQLRHTFCTRLCENETNLKVVQEIMGHSNISTTMNIYNEATIDMKKKSFTQLEGKIKLS